MTQHLKILQDMEDALDDAYAAGIRNSKREWIGLTPVEKAHIWALPHEQWIEATAKLLMEKNT